MPFLFNTNLNSTISNQLKEPVQEKNASNKDTLTGTIGRISLTVRLFLEIRRSGVYHIVLPIEFY
jgi:hypothetical protein